MKHDDIVKILAPCGLDCMKCQMSADGDIRRHSQELKRLLGSFDGYAERFSKFLAVYGNYPQFKDLLDHFSRANCKGCRQGDCKYPNCGVAKCSKSKGVDFCFQCQEFPCNKSNFDPNLHERWIRMNRRMRELGVEAYYEETKDRPRYE
ncbi:MAG: DUF3795 domain-containing protein [Nitrospirota bacterium]